MDKREGEVSRFSFKTFCLTVPKNAVGESFSLSLISGIEKVWMRGWGEFPDFPSKFSSHCTKMFHWRTIWCFRKILSTKIFMHRRGAGHQGS